MCLLLIFGVLLDLANLISLCINNRPESLFETDADIWQKIKNHPMADRYFSLSLSSISICM